MKAYYFAFIIAMADLNMFLSSADEMKAFRKKLAYDRDKGKNCTYHL